MCNNSVSQDSAYVSVDSIYVVRQVVFFSVVTRLMNANERIELYQMYTGIYIEQTVDHQVCCACDILSCRLLSQTSSLPSSQRGLKASTDSLPRRFQRQTLRHVTETGQDILKLDHVVINVSLETCKALSEYTIMMNQMVRLC